MRYQIIWSHFAITELDAIFSYYEENANRKVAQRLVEGIFSETKRLASYPETGAFENRIASDKRKYRRIIHNNYKIIYWINVDQNRVEISDIFDARQNPIKMSRVGDSLDL